MDAQFPWNDVYGPEKFPLPKRFVNKVYRKLTNDFGMFYNGFVNELRPKLFHAHMGEEGTRWLKFVERTQIPLICTFYGMDVSKSGRLPYWKKRYQELFRYGQFFLAEGNYLKKQLVDLGCPEDKIIVQHLGVDLEKYPVKQYSRDLGVRKTVVIQVSSFREKKGIEYSLEAIARLRKAGIELEFRLIGSGNTEESQNRIVSLIDRYGIQDSVCLLGAKTHSETIIEMKNADIFLHPSVTATDGDNEGGAPVGIIEASALGLPIVSTFHADIPEVVINNRSGLLASERDTEGLANALLQLIRNQEQQATMGAFGRRHIELEYNIRKQILKLEHIYDQCHA